MNITTNSTTRFPTRPFSTYAINVRGLVDGNYTIANAPSTGGALFTWGTPNMVADNTTYQVIATGNEIGITFSGVSMFTNLAIEFRELVGSGESAALVNGALPVQINALKYPTSTANSSVAQLASGATFTGTIEDIQALQAAQVMIVSDQAYTVILEQFIDLAGTRKVSVDADYTFVRAAGVTLNENVTLPGNFFRLKVTNNGALSTTTLQIATTFGIMNTQANALGPRSVVASSSVVLCNDLIVGAPASIAALNTDLLTGLASGWFDALAFHSVQVQIVGGASIGAGAIFFEQTNDTTAASAGNIWPVDEDTGLTPTPNIGAITIAASTTRMFGGAVKARYVRVRVSTGFTVGTVQAIANFSQQPYTRMTSTVHQATGANLNAQVIGPAAFGATQSGNPVSVGVVAKTAQPTARTDGQVVAPLFSKVGHAVIRQGQVRDLTDFNAQVTISNATETSIVTAIAATFNDLQSIDIASTLTYSGTPTGVYLVLRDVTAGTVRLSIALPTAGGNFNYARNWMGSELKQATVNTAWTAQLVFVGGTAPAVATGDIRITPQTVRNI